MTRQKYVNRGDLLIAAGGAATFLYEFVFVIVNFTSFIEIGLDSSLMGSTAGGLQAQNPTLFGIWRGERWALWTALGSFILALVVALPIHYVYGLAAIGHVGPFYLVIIAVLVGWWLAYRGMGSRSAR